MTQHDTNPRLITVFVDKFVKGWDGDGSPPAWFQSVPLLDALRQVYQTDAHFGGYWLEINGQPSAKAPRINIAALPAVAANGGKLLHSFGIADIDCAEAHRDGSEAPDDWREQMRALAEQTVPGCLWYDTRAGMRVIWAWQEPLESEQHSEAMRAAIDVLRAAGLPADDLTDANRLFRCAFVMRDGVPQMPQGEFREPAVWHPGPAPAVQVQAQPASVWDRAANVQPRFVLPATIPAGERHHTLKRYAASLRARSCEREEIEQRLLAEAQKYYDAHGKAKDADRDLENIVEWACSLPVGPSTPQVSAGRSAPPPIKSVGLQIPPAFYDTVLERGDSVEMAEQVLRLLEHHSGVPCVYAMGALWSYLPSLGRYVEVDKVQLQQAIASMAGMLIKGRVNAKGQQQYAPLKLTSQTVMDVVRMVQCLRSKGEDWFDGSMCVAFSDCTVEVTPGGIVKHPHSPVWRCTVGYDEPWTDQDPSMWLNFLAEVWADKPAADVQVEIETVGEWVGAMLTRQTAKYQTGIMVTGGGSNGKSTFVYVIEGLVPRNRTTHFAPQHLANEGNKAKVAKAILNSTAEVPSSEITDVAAAVVKALISGDPMHGRYLYENVIDFVPNCAVLLASNNLPPIKDNSHGMWRRIKVLGFDREFSGATVVRDLGKRILDAERTAVACWALRSMVALLQRGEFRETTTSAALKAQWRTASDEVEQWMADLVIPAANPGEGTSCDTLYASFRIWAGSAGIPDSQVLTKRKFFDRLKGRHKPFTAGPSNARRIEYPLLVRTAGSMH